MPIHIENKAGTYREGVDPDGNRWRTQLKADYGYINGLDAVDGDYLDVFLGPNPDNASNVYVVHQVKPGTREYDEDKCLIGFDSKKKAMKAYKGSYDRDDMIGSVEVVDVPTFLQQLRKYAKKKDKGKVTERKHKKPYHEGRV